MNAKDRLSFDATARLAFFYIDVNVTEESMTALGRTLQDRADDDRPALLFGDRSWSYRELVQEGWRRAALFDQRRDPDRPPHVGVLLDNVPDHLFWLTSAALSGHVVVGINSTYRGAQLAQLIDRSRRIAQSPSPLLLLAHPLRGSAPDDARRRTAAEGVVGRGILVAGRAAAVRRAGRDVRRHR